MFRKIIIVSLVFVQIATVSAQTPTSIIQKDVVADSRLETLLSKHIEVNEQNLVSGYRIQIYFGGDRSKATSIKGQFLSSKGPKISAYETYDAPNFKIRIGDFRTRLEAHRYLKEIKGEFPSSFIIESEIEYSN